MQKLFLQSPAFAENEMIPKQYTARGEDFSPPLCLSGLDAQAVALALTLDDASHPLFPNYNHWVIWNLPPLSKIPAAIPAGETVEALGGAMQGVAYGRHCYHGPKPPLRANHRYVFTAYALECRLLLPPKSTREDFLRAAKGHILQSAALAGYYQSRK